MTDPDASTGRRQLIDSAEAAGAAAPLAAPDQADPVAVAERIRRGPARTGPVRVVGVDGPSGSGKSTYADRLGRELGCQIVHLDDLIPGWDGLASGPGTVHDDVLVPLAEGRPAGYRRYDWVTGSFAEWQDVAAAPYLVLEGVGAGARINAHLLTLLIWVQAPLELRFVRGIDRDGESYRPLWEHWAAWEERHYAVERTRERADLRIDGTA